MHKKFMATTSGAQAVKEALLSFPGAATHTEEGIASGAVGITVFGVPVFIRYSNIYADKKCNNSRISLNTTRILHIYYENNEYVSIFNDDHKSHVVTILKADDSKIALMNQSYFVRSNGEDDMYTSPLSLSPNRGLFRSELNALYVCDFQIPCPIKNYLNEFVWAIDDKKSHENIKLFSGYTNIEQDDIFQVGDQEWSCVAKGNNVFLGLKRV